MTMQHDELVEMMLECGCMMPESDGIDMLMANLAKIAEYSSEVMRMVQGQEDLEDWVENKVSQAAKDISDIKHYLEFRMSGYAQHSGLVPGNQPMGSEVVPSGVGGGYEGGEKMAVMTQQPVMTAPAAELGVDDMEMSLSNVFDGNEDVPLSAERGEMDEEPLPGEEDEDDMLYGVDDMDESEMDDVGEEDEDIDNDGDVDDSDDYLANRREKISQNMDESLLDLFK